MHTYTYIFLGSQGKHNRKERGSKILREIVNYFVRMIEMHGRVCDSGHV